MQRLDFQQPRPVPFPMLLGCPEEAARASSASHAPLSAFRLAEWRSQSPSVHCLELVPTWSCWSISGTNKNVKPGHHPIIPFKIGHLQPSRAVSSQEFLIGDAVSLEPSSNDCVVLSCFRPPVPGVQLSCSGASPLRLKSSCWPPFGHRLWRERSWPCSRMQRIPTIANPFRILGASDMCGDIKAHETPLNSTVSFL